MIWALGAAAVLGLLLARPRLDEPADETGRWAPDGPGSAPSCARCGRRMKRAGVRLVDVDDPDAPPIVAGRTCARRLADGAVCTRCSADADLPPLDTSPQSCCSAGVREWTGAPITYADAWKALYDRSFRESREGKHFTPTHTAAVRMLGRLKRQAYAECRRTCDLQALDGAWIHYRGDRYDLTESQRGDGPTARVTRRGKVWTARDPDGSSVYTGTDRAAAIEAARATVADPFASSWSPSATGGGDDVPF